MQSNQPSKRHFLELILSVLFISSSGPLGKTLTIAPELSIWGRSVAAIICMMIIRWFLKFPLTIRDKSHIVLLVVGGLLMTTHWVSYFYSLYHSSVAVAMLSVFTFPVISSFLEPLFFKTKIIGRQILLALLVLGGLCLIAPFGEENTGVLAGIGFGVLAATAFSFRNIIVKKMMLHYTSSTIMTYHILIAIIVLTPFLLKYEPSKMVPFWPQLLALGLFTTALGHSLFANAFRYFSVTTSSIIAGLQPFFGILMAVLFIGEKIDLKTVIGGLLILSTVFYEGIAVIIKRKKYEP